MSPANQLSDALSTLRRDWKRRVMLESAVIIVATALLAVVAGVLLTKVLGPGGSTIVAARVLGYVLIAAAFARYFAWPLLRRTNDERFALYVEEHAPELRQGLLSAVHEMARPESERASPSLTARMIERVLVTLRALTGEHAIERPRMQRALKALGAIAVIGALILGLGPASLRETAALLFAPWGTASAAVPVLSLRVEPGNATIPKGGSVDITAQLVNFTADGAELVFRADTSGDWIHLPMSQDSAATGFTSRLFDLTRSTEYFVESQGIRSATYKLEVSNLPAVSKLALELRFPAYTGQEPERIENGGDVAAIVGTTVIVRPTVTMPVKGGTIRFDDGKSAELTAGANSQLSGSFKISGDGFYRIDLVAQDGRTVPGRVQYAIEALQDHAPGVFIDKPGRDTRVTSVDEVMIEARASDDFGVTRLELRYSVNGGEEKRVVLADAGLNHAKEVRAAHTIFLEELGLQPGDLVSYHAAARDGAGNQSLSDVYFIDVRPFGLNYRQSEQRGGGGGGGGQQDNPAQFVQRERDVVAGTFNWLRDSAKKIDQQRRDDMATITTAQGRLREDVATLVRQLTDRGIVQEDTTFAKIQRELATAVTEMETAEKNLGAGAGRIALTPEQKALQHLQRADAMYRDRQLQMGGERGGGGGGGGQQQRAEDLADLFELERDKLANQYEAVQQQSQQQQQQQQQVDQTLEKMRQLASRQQQENERMQRMADALRDRLGQQQASGGGGGAQRDLARQAEEEARRLERLAREQNNPQLAQAAQRMQQAADAMRKAANGSTAEGQAALDQLRNAQRGLENSRTDGLSENVKQLADKAGEIQERQRQIASDVASLDKKADQERQQAARDLSQRKSALATDVAKLEQGADQAARQARKEQPGASARLGAAAETIRDQRIRDKIDWSRTQLGGSAADYLNNLENQIRDNLGEVSDQLKKAASALTGESASKQQDRALAQMREQVQSLESLRDRIGARTGQNQAERDSSAQRQAQDSRGQSQGQRGEAQGQLGQQGQQGQRGDAQGQQGLGQGGRQGQGQGGRQGQQQGQQQSAGRQGGANQQQGDGRQGQAQSNDGRGGRGNQNNQNFGGSGNPSNRLTPLTPTDARQFAREFTARRDAAEALRNALRRQGVNTTELDRAIDQLAKLDGTTTVTGDPKTLDKLQADVIEGFKQFEFSLFKQLGIGSSKQPATGMRADIPPEYRALVEEYYKAISKKQ